MLLAVVACLGLSLGLYYFFVSGWHFGDHGFFKSASFTDIYIELEPEHTSAENNSLPYLSNGQAIVGLDIGRIYENSLERSLSDGKSELYGFLHENGYLVFKEIPIPIKRENVPNRVFASLVRSFHHYTDKLTPYLARSTSGVPSLKIAQRHLLKVTYSNSYSTGNGFPFRGNTKVQVINFLYDLVPTLPAMWISDGQTYQGSVKMFRDPDDGQWKIAERNLPDSVESMLGKTSKQPLGNFIAESRRKTLQKFQEQRSAELRGARQYRFEVNNANESLICHLTTDDAVSVEPLRGAYQQISLIHDTLYDSTLENRASEPAPIVKHARPNEYGGVGGTWKTSDKLFVDMQDMQGLQGREKVRASRVHIGLMGDDFSALVTVYCVDNYNDVSVYDSYNLKQKHLMSCATRFNDVPPPVQETTAPDDSGTFQQRGKSGTSTWFQEAFEISVDSLKQMGAETVVNMKLRNLSDRTSRVLIGNGMTLHSLGRPYNYGLPYLVDDSGDRHNASMPVWRGDVCKYIFTGNEWGGAGTVKVNLPPRQLVDGAMSFPRVRTGSRHVTLVIPGPQGWQTDIRLTDLQLYEPD